MITLFIIIIIPTDIINDTGSVCLFRFQEFIRFLVFILHPWHRLWVSTGIRLPDLKLSYQVQGGLLGVGPELPL
jgi:hypothetical protein